MMRLVLERSKKYLWLCIIASGAAVYFNSLWTPFVYDDYLYIVDNERLRSLWPIWDTVFNTARPLVYFTWALNYAAGKLDTFGYHLVNLTIHISSALLLFGIVRRTLLSARLKSKYASASAWLAFVSALFWAIHPLTTESVTFIYQRAESMMGFFYLLTLYCVIRSVSSKKATRWQTMAIVTCACGMASKAIMASGPLIILAYDRLFLSRSFKGALQKRRGLYIGLGATWLLLAWLLFAASNEYATSAGYGYKSATALQYLGTQPGVVLHYLRLALWPSTLVFDYYGWPIARGWLAIGLPAAFVLSLIILTVAALRKGILASFIGVWFFGILAPTSSIIPISDFIVEHRMYLPLAGVVILAVLAGYHLIRRLLGSAGNWARLTVYLLIVLPVGLALGRATVARNSVYRSVEVLWKDVIAKRPDNSRAHYALGIYMGDNGRLDEAVQYFAKAYELQPRYFESHFNMAVALSRQKKYAEAFRRFEEMVKINPNSALVRYAYGLSLSHAGKIDEAIHQFDAGLAISPDFQSIHYNLAVALLIKQQPGEAVGHFARAIMLQMDPQIRDEIASVVGQVGLTDAVMAEIKQAHAMKPAGAP